MHPIIIVYDSVPISLHDLYRCSLLTQIYQSWKMRGWKYGATPLRSTVEENPYSVLILLAKWSVQSAHLAIHNTSSSAEMMSSCFVVLLLFCFVLFEVVGLLCNPWTGHILLDLWILMNDRNFQIKCLPSSQVDPKHVAVFNLFSILYS